jgi:hypothetical protein
MAQELAVIDGVGFGMRDCPSCVLWFGVKMLVGGTLVIMGVLEAVELIEKHHIREIQDLDGMPCIVESEGLGGNVKFIDLKPR